MKYKNYLDSVRQGYEDPTEYNEEPRYCQLCNIEENKTYFVGETCICEDCHENTKDEPYLTTETKAD